MARSRKKSVSQNIVNVATTGMPQPARKLLGNRWIAKLTILAVPLLFATGILSLQWVNGRPSVQFNREKAKQVEQKAVQRIDALRDEIAKRRTSGPTVTGEARERISKALHEGTEGR